MKYFFIWIFMLVIVFSLSAQVWNEYKQHTIAIGIHYIFRIIPPVENTLEYIFISSRLGVKFEYIYNFSGSIGLGAEILVDSDILSFINRYYHLELKIEEIYEFRGRIIFCYNLYLIKFIPLAGICFLSVPGLDISYNLEAGLNLTFQIRPHIEIEVEGCYCFLTGWNIIYENHLIISLGFKYAI